MVNHWPTGNRRASNWSRIGLLLLVSIVALSFFFSPGTGDVSIWQTWMRQIYQHGLIGGYAQSDTDYPPLAFIILGIVVKCASAFGTSPFLILKCSLFLFLAATAACFYWFTRNVVLTVALAFSLILNSVALGYLDIYFAPFLITAFFLLQRGRLGFGFILFAITCAIKWQSLIVAPFVCVYVFAGARSEISANNSPWAKRLMPFALSAVLAVVLLLIFGTKIFDSLQRAMTRHAFLSAYALNLPWLQTWALHLIDPAKYGALKTGEIDIFLTRDPAIVWPDKILFYVTYFAVLIGFARRSRTFEKLVIYSILGYLAYFCFNTGVHENHLFLVCCLAWVLVFISERQLVRGINLTLAANANLFLFYGVYGDRLQRVIAGVDITLLFALANLALFVGFLIETIKTDGLDLWLIKFPPRQPASN